jgi:hypothetical protein
LPRPLPSPPLARCPLKNLSFFSCASRTLPIFFRETFQMSNYLRHIFLLTWATLFLLSPGLAEASPHESPPDSVDVLTSAMPRFDVNGNRITDSTAGLLRDATSTSGVLENKFDLEKIEKNQAFAKVIAEESFHTIELGGQLVYENKRESLLQEYVSGGSALSASEYKSKLETVEKDWGDGGTYRTILHGVSAVAQLGVGGGEFVSTGIGSRDLIGKVWTAPNTAIYSIYGLAGTAYGLATGEKSDIKIGNNAIEFINLPVMPTAMTIGNAIIYGEGEYDKRTQNHERQHTYQAEALGPVYGVAHLILLGAAQFINGNHHGPVNVLETGPQIYGAPRPWVWSWSSIGIQETDARLFMNTISPPVKISPPMILEGGVK